MSTSEPLPCSNDDLRLIARWSNSGSEPLATRAIELAWGLPLAAQLTEPLSRYCPHRPWPKQQTFLAVPGREALFGGAAGGGKSDALLMGALQHVNVPGYAALILRKDTARLKLAGGLIPRSQQWLATTAAKWNETKLRWTFPTDGAPATISFGYLTSTQDKYRYGSSEYQYIAFDELTELAEDDYLFLFSRLRKRRGMNVPLQMRAATNPGGPGHAWVKNRFIPEGFAAGQNQRSYARQERGGRGEDSTSGDQALGELSYGRGGDVNSPGIFYKDDRAFVPATIADNPALDEREYRRSLAHLPAVVRQRLMNGDWSAMEAGLIGSAWLRYYRAQGSQFDLLGRNGELLANIGAEGCRRFVTCDPAGTSEDRAREQRGRSPSYTVIQVWDQPRDPTLSRFLLLRHVVRRRVGFDGLCRCLTEVHRDWQPERLLIENEKLGRAAYDVLAGTIPLECIATGGRDKVTRAAPLLAKLERGEVFLPQLENSWLTDLEAEWLAWTGLNDATTDQIDAAAYAAVYAEGRHRGPLVIEPIFIPYL